MLVYYDDAIKNIDIAASEFRNPHPVIAQVKYDAQNGLRDLFEGLPFRRGAVIDTSADATEPFESILTSNIDDVWDSAKTETLEKNNAVFQLLESFLQSNIFSSRWKDDGIAEPTKNCTESALSLSMLIFEKFDILPVRIAPSIEEGVMITYQQGSDKLLVEAYNTGEIAGLLRSGANILKADDFEKQQDVLSLVSEYKKKLS